jgi:hypothetical protein
MYNRAGKRELRKSLMYMHDDIQWLDKMSKEFKIEYLTKLIENYPDDVRRGLKNKIR